MIYTSKLDKNTFYKVSKYGNVRDGIKQLRFENYKRRKIRKISDRTLYDRIRYHYNKYINPGLNLMGKSAIRALADELLDMVAIIQLINHGQPTMRDKFILSGIKAAIHTQLYHAKNRGKLPYKVPTALQTTANTARRHFYNNHFVKSVIRDIQDIKKGKYLKEVYRRIITNRNNKTWSLYD